MTTAKLVIFRHGQTEYNKQGLMTGQREVPLTALGEEQAREAGVLIRDIHFDKVYSSTLSRAFNTAALALEASKTQVHLLNADGTWQIEQRKEVIELDTGDFTGRCHKTDPEIIAHNNQYDVPLPGGESKQQLVERVKVFIDNEVMPRLLRGENVLIVAHAGIVRSFDIALGLESPPVKGVVTPRKHIFNAAPTVYEYEDGVIVNSFALQNSKEPKAANENTPPSSKKKHGPKL